MTLKRLPTHRQFWQQFFGGAYPSLLQCYSETRCGLLCQLPCVPMMNAFRFFADAGGLMTYGATASEIYKSAADQVAKVLGGARPSELPLQEATRFELVTNNWTAKALGITIPPSLLVRADEVIESPPPFATH